MSESDNFWVVDLWGNRVYAVPRKRGRPPFERTEENANKVSMLLAMGWSNARIAGAILDPRTGKRISEPTLRRYFRPELQERDFARDRLIARQLEVAAEAAFQNGNVGAMRFLQQLVEKNDMMAAEALLGRMDTRDAQPKQGKKEISASAADEAERSLMAELDAEAQDRVKH